MRNLPEISETPYPCGENRTQLHPGNHSRHDRRLGLPAAPRPDGRPSASHPEPKPLTPAQQNQRDRFRAAQDYAARVLANPFHRLEYQKLGRERKRPPNTLLMANFLNPPVIEQTDLSGYAGGVGEAIWIMASDAIEVVSVTVTIRGVDDALIESGSADKDHGVWVYRSQTSLPAGTARKVEVCVRNRANTEARQLF